VPARQQQRPSLQATPEGRSTAPRAASQARPSPRPKCPQARGRSQPSPAVPPVRSAMPTTAAPLAQEDGHLRQPCHGCRRGGWIGVSGAGERAEGPLEGPCWAVGACSERPAAQAGRPRLSSQHQRFML
jgi:hypothetical protein